MNRIINSLLVREGLSLPYLTSGTVCSSLLLSEPRATQDQQCWFLNFYWIWLIYYYFLVYSKVNQLYKYISALLFGFFSHIGLCTSQSIELFVLYSSSLFVMYFIYSSVYMLVSQVIPSLPFTTGNRVFSKFVTLFVFCTMFICTGFF